jgi:DNA processing protein
MFGYGPLVDARETAAVLALMRRKDAAVPMKQLAGAIEDAGSALAFLGELESSSPDRLFSDAPAHSGLDQLEDQVHRWAADGIRLVTVLDEAYPGNLRTVYDRPPALFVRGGLKPGDDRSVAVVGARKASDHGLEHSARIATDLVGAGYVVVSGLAMGVDTAAHRAALEAGGRTIAVIGSGVLEYAPKRNRDLQDRIAAEHAVVSQFWPEDEARPWTFPMRNAVMSGFARATVVVEATNTSGARMQARLALEHGRPVFLLRSLLKWEWAAAYQDYPSVYVIDEAAEVIDHLDRLWSESLTFA